MRYWVRLLRPGWLLGVAITGSALAGVLVLAGLVDSVPGTVNGARMIAAVLSVGVAAAFLEASAMVTDATPWRRVRRRLTPPALALAAVIPLGAALAFAQATRVTGVPWPAVLLQATGLVMLAAATGAACRNRVDPGLIAPAVVVGLITLDARAPWEPILTAAPDTKVNLAWATVVVLTLPVIVLGIGDPAGRSLRRLAAAAAHRAGEHPAGEHPAGEYSVAPPDPMFPSPH